jgi:hypothetical protein
LSRSKEKRWNGSSKEEEVKILLDDLKKAVTYLESKSPDITIQMEEIDKGFILGAYDRSQLHVQIIIFNETLRTKPKVTSTTGLT